MSGITLKPSTARRVMRVLERDELRPFGEQGRPRPTADAIEMHVVSITSTTQTDGMYPGLRWEHEADGNTKTAAAPPHVVWVDTLNGEALATGTYYWAKFAGVKADDSVEIYQPVSAISSFSGADLRIATTSPGVLSAPVNLAAGDWDTDSYWNSASPTDITVSSTGYYLISACAGASFTGFMPAYITLVIKANGRSFGDMKILEGARTEATLSASNVFRMVSGMIARIYMSGTATFTIQTPLAGIDNFEARVQIAKVG